MNARIFIFLFGIAVLAGCASMPAQNDVAGYYTNTVQVDEPWRFLNLLLDGRYYAEAHWSRIVVEGTDGVERDQGTWSLEGSAIVLRSISRPVCIAPLAVDDGVLKVSWNRIELLRKGPPNQSLQPNAGNRPSSGDSSASETPSSPGPRG